jgi:signal transduction histidine kinase/CheY-like chemotaxis protein
LDQIFGEEDGLPTHSIFSLFEDSEHGLWATSDSNIFRLALNTSSTFFDQKAGLQNQPILKIARSQGRINVAAVNGLSEMDPHTGSFRAGEFPMTHVMDLQPASRDLLVAGFGGIKRISEGKTTVFLSTPQSAFLVKPSRVWPGNMLVSDEHSVFLVDPDGQSRVLVRNLPDIVTSVAEDDQGRLWMGTTARAVLMARPNDAAPVEAVSAGTAFGLPDSSGPGRVAAAADGTVLAFSSSGGWRLGRHAAGFIAIEKFPAWSVNAVSEADSDGTAWVLHAGTESRSASVARIVIHGDRAVWQPHSVEGLWKVGMPECILAEAGAAGETTLWIGGTTGLLRNVVAHGPLAPVPRPPLLHTLARSAGTDVLQPIGQPLPYSTRAVVFEFAAPEFARRPALHLETLLDGVDQHWMPADASSHREFTALREGRYTFRVRTVAETGVAGPATVRHFEITPPWWRTGTAILGALLALAPAGYGVYRWRVRRLRQRNTELELKVIERTAQLEKASAAKTQFVANMSHDIRNPLNGIVGLALALEDTWLDVKQRELVATLRECTTYLSTLVDDVLDFATIEAGQVELRPAPFSPAELLRSIAMMFKMEAISSGAVLEVEADALLPAAYVGDAGRIQQILVNFVTNALKYSGGPIQLSVTIPADAPEEIEFSVTDHGPGISEEGQRLLFAKFSRLTGSQSKEITGTGLGLASCRLLAGLMSGSVGVYSSPGQGARFFLRLPLDIFPIPAADSPAAPMAAPIVPNCTVLLVEDTNYNAMAAAAVLSKFGLSCERVSTGAEALRLFAEKRHNLVLLDRNLPDMDGTEVARRIRALESTGPRAIILAVTAYCTLEDRALCLNAGMDAFVGKPLTPQKLRRVLTAAGRRHLAAASMHVSPDVSSTGVDVSLLEYISDGTDQGLNRQIELFLIALGGAGKQLQQAARTTDYKLMGDAAHGVLSHARLVGSASLATAAAGLQSAALAHDREAFGSLLLRVQREIESLTATVRRHPGAERPA